MLKLDFSPITQDISLDVDGDVRCFRLREHSVANGVEFLRRFDVLRMDRARTESLDIIDQGSAAWEALAASADDLFLWLLGLKGVPLDTPADEAWVAGLVLSQRRRIIDLQTTLNQIEDIAPNLLAVLVYLQAARTAVQLVGEMPGDGGKSVSQSPPPDPEADTTPSGMQPTEPPDKPLSSTGLPSETPGEPLTFSVS